MKPPVGYEPTGKAEPRVEGFSGKIAYPQAAGAPLDNGNVDARQRQLACQHRDWLRLSLFRWHRHVGFRS